MIDQAKALRQCRKTIERTRAEIQKVLRAHQLAIKADDKLTEICDTLLYTLEATTDGGAK